MQTSCYFSFRLFPRLIENNTFNLGKGLNKALALAESEVAGYGNSQEVGIDISYRIYYNSQESDAVIPIR